jgi:uncharacterized DUF497 family protein
MVIERLIWDDWKEEHILKHGCTVDDVNLMCKRRVHHWRDSCKDRLSARPVDRKEREFYERKEREENSTDR